MSVITVPRPLKDKLGDDATDAFVEVVKEIDLSSRQEAILIAEERLERRLTDETGKINERITAEISKVNERITSELGKVNERMSSELGKVNERITRVEKELENKASKADLANVKFDIVKWMFIFWASQLIAIFGLLKFMIK